MPFSFGKQEYTTPGSHTFTVPAGVYWVLVSAIGGGGGCGVNKTTVFASFGCGAGGAGEHIIEAPLATTPGGTVSIVVGAGGAGGVANVQGVNAHAAEGPGGFDAGNGGGSTTVGPFVVLGGYGGLGGLSSPHAGIGGGYSALHASGNLPNCGESLNGQGPDPNGRVALRGNSVRWFSGSGGGAGMGAVGGVGQTGGKGGPCGPFLGGAGGAPTATLGGGGGGAASPWGPGGAGGAAPAGNGNSPPAGSYGAGAGGGGGIAGGAAPGTSAPGLDGYVLLTWETIT